MTLDEELWYASLAEKSGIDTSQSIQLWNHCLIQINSWLSQGFSVRLLRDARWVLCLGCRRECVAQLPTGELWLIPPAITLDLRLGSDLTSREVVQTLLPDDREEQSIGTQVDAPWEQIVAWFEALEGVLQSSSVVDLPHLGRLGYLSNGVTLLPTPDFFSRLNKPFSVFSSVRLEGISESIADLEVVQTASFEDLLTPQVVTIIFDSASCPSSASEEPADLGEEVIVFSEDVLDGQKTDENDGTVCPEFLLQEEAQAQMEHSSRGVDVEDEVAKLPVSRDGVVHPVHSDEMRSGGSCCGELGAMPEASDSSMAEVTDALISGDVALDQTSVPVDEEESSVSSSSRHQKSLMLWVVVTLFILLFLMVLYHFVWPLNLNDSSATTQQVVSTVSGAGGEKKTSAADGLARDTLQDIGWSSTSMTSSVGSMDKAESTLTNTNTVAGEKIKLRSGDKLTHIALHKYGHKAFWVYIYEENQSIIRNPDNIPIGTELILPPAEKYAISALDTNSIHRALELEWQIRSHKYKHHNK